MDNLEFIANCAQIATILEVNANKPGNVNPDHDFKDTKYEHYIAGGIGIRNSIYNSALNGFKASKGEIKISEICIGECMKNAIYSVKKSHSGGNTHLGIVMLLVPISAGAGMCTAKDFSDLKDNIKKIITRTTVEDSLNLYDAIILSGAGGLGTDNLDVKDQESKNKIIEKNITLYDLMLYSAPKDRIAEELSNGMPIIFEVATPIMQQIYQRTNDIRSTIIQTYLTLLSRFPDTLISRKFGIQRSNEISRKAEEVIIRGGVLTDYGKESINEFDDYLRRNEINPGTTADIVTGSLMVSLLKWLRF